MGNEDPLDGTLSEGPQADPAAEATEQADWKWLMADPRGLRIVRGLLERSGVFRTSFTGDAPSTFFREGERNAGLQVIGLVQRHAPERLAELLVEGRR